MTTLVLYAPNVHTGGGAILLKELLLNAPENQKIIAFLDSRIASQINTLHLKNISIKHWVRPTIISRICAEVSLAKLNKNAKIFCFHNIPPILNKSKTTVVFFQNRLIIQPELRKYLGFRLSVISNIERVLNIVFQHKVQSYIVQTQSMKASLEKSMAQMNKRNIEVIPFMYPINDSSKSIKKEDRWDFIYISSGDPHKNHSNLIEAWGLLASENFFPTLCLTVDNSNKNICKLIENSKRHLETKITNLGTLDHKMALQLCKGSKALIFPSKSESFGLPLIEASAMGIPILAGELDFVRDVCNPDETFDPNSPTSIARSVKRFLKVNETRKPFIDAKKFWGHLL